MKEVKLEQKRGDTGESRDADAEAPGGGAVARAGQRRDALLEAATELFLSHGFAATSLDMVIARAGGSRRAIYEHFGNKKGLFVAVIEAQLSRVMAQLRPLELAGDDMHADLTEVGCALVRTLSEPRSVGGFRLIIAEAERFPDLAARFYAGGPGRAEELVAKYLMRQKQYGITEIKDATRAAQYLLDMIKGDRLIKALLGLSPPLTEMALKSEVSMAVGVFLKSLSVFKDNGKA